MQIWCFFLQLASGIYNFACSLWNHHTDTFLQQISSGSGTAVLSSLERTLLSLKGTVKPDVLWHSCQEVAPDRFLSPLSLGKMGWFLCKIRTRELFSFLRNLSKYQVISDIWIVCYFGLSPLSMFFSCASISLTFLSLVPTFTIVPTVLVLTRLVEWCLLSLFSLNLTFDIFVPQACLDYRRWR